MSEDGYKGQRLDTFIRARLAKEQKERLEQLATERQLKATDILREAVRDYLRRIDEPARLQAA